MDGHPYTRPSRHRYCIRFITYRWSVHVNLFFLPMLVFDMRYSGSESTERDGILWVVSDIDHPAGLTARSPNLAVPGTSTVIGMKIKKVTRSVDNNSYSTSNCCVASSSASPM